MSDLEKAARDAVEAADNTQMVQQIAAILAAQQLLNAQQPQQPAPAHTCQHEHRRQGRSAGEWLGIACAVCVGGVGIAFASLALAILGGVAAIVVLVLRDMWRDMQRKGR